MTNSGAVSGKGSPADVFTMDVRNPVKFFSIVLELFQGKGILLIQPLDAALIAGKFSAYDSKFKLAGKKYPFAFNISEAFIKDFQDKILNSVEVEYQITSFEIFVDGAAVVQSFDYFSKVSIRQDLSKDFLEGMVRMGVVRSWKKVPGAVPVVAKNGWKAVAWEWGESIIVALLLALIIRAYLFQPFRIPSGSMRMTLIEGDRLFVNKLAYGPSLIPVEIRTFSPADAIPNASSSWGRFLRTRVPGFTSPKRGDVVVFRYPVTRDKDFIKRLIAFGGETVQISDGKVLINDQPITDGSISKIFYYNRGDYGVVGQRVKVPEGYFFVMGDNSGSSHDSRYWGFVPEHFLIGKADVIFWPLNRVGWIK